MKNFKAELLEDGKVIKTFEQQTDLDWNKWRYNNALDYLKPKGREIKWYINNEIKLS